MAISRFSPPSGRGVGRHRNGRFVAIKVRVVPSDAEVDLLVDLQSIVDLLFKTTGGMGAPSCPSCVGTDDAEAAPLRRAPTGLWVQTETERLPKINVDDVTST